MREDALGINVHFDPNDVQVEVQPGNAAANLHSQVRDDGTILLWLNR